MNRITTAQLRDFHEQHWLQRDDPEAEAYAYEQAGYACASLPKRSPGFELAVQSAWNHAEARDMPDVSNAIAEVGCKYALGEFGHASLWLMKAEDSICRDGEDRMREHCATLRTIIEATMLEAEEAERMIRVQEGAAS